MKLEEYNGALPSLVSTTHSWTKPVGTGFSFSTQVVYKPSDSREAKRIHEFLQKWLGKHEEFIPNPLYVGGDSYSGKTVPALVQESSKGNTKCLELVEEYNKSLNIMTDIAATICVQSTYWWLDTFDKEREKEFVTAGPKPQGSSEETLRSYFQIQKAGNGAYKFGYCLSDSAGSYKVSSPNCFRSWFWMWMKRVLVEEML
ncbi:hypothetical protein Bca4012_056751 [Brassica carinata]